MDFGGSSYASLRNATTTSVHGLIGSTASRHNELIIIAVVVVFVFSVICCVSRTLDQHYPSLGQPGDHTLPCNQCKRIEFVKSHLPSRDMQDDGADIHKWRQIVDVEAGSLATTCQTQPNTTTPESARQHPDDDIEKGITSSENKQKAAPIVFLAPQASFVSCKGSRAVCSICLGSYHAQEKVAWSTNPKCPHEYHRTCIEPWLIKHEECPLCRCTFLLEESAPPVVSTAPQLSSQRPVAPPHPWQAYWLQRRRL